MVAHVGTNPTNLNRRKIAGRARQLIFHKPYQKLGSVWTVEAVIRRRCHRRFPKRIRNSESAGNFESKHRIEFPCFARQARKYQSIRPTEKWKSKRPNTLKQAASDDQSERSERQHKRMIESDFQKRLFCPRQIYLKYLELQVNKTIDYAHGRCIENGSAAFEHAGFYMMPVICMAKRFEHFVTIDR